MIRTESDAAPRGTPEPPGDAASAVFGHRLGTARRYATLLAGDGVAHGHLGPREVDRLWDRHLINSALVADLVPAGARVVDVGSGAGLPGIPMVIRRPDLRVDLVEPMRRRTEFLLRVVADLELAGQVRVVRGRADDSHINGLVGGADWVVARAVAPLDRLVRWTLPLLAPGGRLLALKGSSATAEVDEHRRAVTQAGGRQIEITQLGGTAGTTPTWVVSIQRAPHLKRSARGNDE